MNDMHVKDIIKLYPDQNNCPDCIVKIIYTKLSLMDFNTLITIWPDPDNSPSYVLEIVYDKLVEYDKLVALFNDLGKV